MCNNDKKKVCAKIKEYECYNNLWKNSKNKTVKIVKDDEYSFIKHVFGQVGHLAELVE